MYANNLLKTRNSCIRYRGNWFSFLNFFLQNVRHYESSLRKKQLRILRNCDIPPQTETDAWSKSRGLYMYIVFNSDFVTVVAHVFMWTIVSNSNKLNNWLNTHYWFQKLLIVINGNLVRAFINCSCMYSIFLFCPNFLPFLYRLRIVLKYILCIVTIDTNIS